MHVSGSPRLESSPMIVGPGPSALRRHSLLIVLTGENPSDVPLRTIRMSWSDQPDSSVISVCEWDERAMSPPGGDS